MGRKITFINCNLVWFLIKKMELCGFSLTHVCMLSQEGTVEAIKQCLQGTDIQTVDVPFQKCIPK